MSYWDFFIKDILLLQDAAFVVDGWALEIALKHHRKAFTELAILSRTAICCRVTPSQKAQVCCLIAVTILRWTIISSTVCIHLIEFPILQGISICVNFTSKPMNLVVITNSSSLLMSPECANIAILLYLGKENPLLKFSFNIYKL